jgi:class 3 adenylate cyclase
MALAGRAAALVLASILPAIFSTTALLVSVVILISVAAGLAYRRVVGTRSDRTVFRFAIFSADILMVGAIFAFLPLSVTEDVPQHLAFEVYGIHYFLPILGAAALSLSPALILWCGAAIIVTWQVAFASATTDLTGRLDWRDLGAPFNYEELILHPNFASTGTRIEESVVLLVLTALIAFAVHRARRVVGFWDTADEARSRITDLFGRFAPPEIVARLAEDSSALAPTRREATVLFADIAGFTALSESRPPETMLALLNTYFERAGRIAAAHGGVIVNFQGDGLLLVFNAPADVPDHAAAALRTARGLLRAVEESAFEGETIAIRIGIHTGPVAAGIAASADRQTYTVYGDTVNVASRLEALNKERGSRLMISAETAMAAGGPADLVDLGDIRVRGHSTPLRVYGDPRDQP